MILQSDSSLSYSVVSARVFINRILHRAAEAARAFCRPLFLHDRLVWQPRTTRRRGLRHQALPPLEPTKLMSTNTNSTSSNSLRDRITYYPITPTEVATLRKLGLSIAAFTLLLLIKSVAPFGNKVMFTDEVNPKTMQVELEMNRVTFWRARKELLKRQLIEFNNHYIRDCHTADRSQFKPHEPTEPVKATASKLPAAQALRSPTGVAKAQPLLQSCNDRGLKGKQGNRSGERKTLKPNLPKKTTRHSELEEPTHHPVVSFSGSAPKPTANSQKGVWESTPSSPSPDPKNRKQATNSGADKVFPGEFSTLKTKLDELGIRFNRNLLRAFQQAGFERVQQAIAYLAERLKDPSSPIKNAAAYLVELVRHGENMAAAEPRRLERETLQAFIRWVDEARERRIINASYEEKATGELMVIACDGLHLTWQQAVEKYQWDE